MQAQHRAYSTGYKVLLRVLATVSKAFLPVQPLAPLVTLAVACRLGRLYRHLDRGRLPFEVEGENIHRANDVNHGQPLIVASGSAQGHRHRRWRSRWTWRRSQAGSQRSRHRRGSGQGT